MAKKKEGPKKSNSPEEEKDYSVDLSKDKLGTIHDLPALLANLAELDKERPTSKKQIAQYIKEFEELGLFTPKATKAKKEDIIKKLKLINYNKDKVERYQSSLKSVTNFNRIIDRHLRRVENEIRAGVDVKKNEDYRRGREKMVINIPRKIRDDLGITNKAVKLIKYSAQDIRNKIKYHSGQDYDFQIKTGFIFNPTYIPYDKLQQIRIEGNVVDYVLTIFEDAVNYAYQRDKRDLQKKDKVKWSQKMKVYQKIYKVIEHNRQIATNKLYNKKLVQRNEEGGIKKNSSEYPIFLELFNEMIDIYIP